MNPQKTEQNVSGKSESETGKSSPVSAEETPEERAQRHAGLNFNYWMSLKGCCGVEAGFHMASLKDYPEEFAKEVRDAVRGRSWIYFWGKLGTGKTHLLSALVRSRFIWGWDCWFVFVPEFLARLKRSFDNSTEEMTGDLLHHADNCDLLALDDIGVEKSTEWASSTLTTIVNNRYAKGLATAFSANLSVDALGKRYPRLADRIREKALVISLDERRPERG